MLTIVKTAIALAILASLMAWSASNAKQTHRSIQYVRSMAAAIEKGPTRITRDFLSGGKKLVNGKMDNDSYRTHVPTTKDSAHWGQWQFNDATGNNGRTYVQGKNSTNFVVRTAPYAGLQAFISNYTVVTHARDTVSVQPVVGGVLEAMGIIRISIFKFVARGKWATVAENQNSISVVP